MYIYSMKTKNTIKANDKGTTKFGYSESSRMVSTLKRKDAARFNEEEFEGAIVKSTKKKKRDHVLARFIRSDKSAKSLKSYTFKNYTFKKGCKVTFDGLFLKKDEDYCSMSREGWLYNNIKLIVQTKQSIFIIMDKNQYGNRTVNELERLNIRPYDHNPQTNHGTYAQIEEDFDEAIEFFAEFPGKESDLVEFKGCTKKDYKKYSKYHNKAKKI